MHFKRYIPLFVLVIVALLGASALMLGHHMTLLNGMQLFMGLVFCQFAMLKLFHLTQFVEGFQKYDWLGKKSLGYAYFYPFLELILGLAYLSGVWPFVVNVITVAVLSMGAYGVIRALRAGLDVRCACMGTILDVPLSTVTLTEDIGMGIMAIIMLWKEIF